MNEPLVKVIPSPFFIRRAKQLRKRYPHISQDIQPLIAQLERGETPGDRVQSGNYVIYKARLPNQDAQRGKSGGYRVIYYLRTAHHLVLLTLYAKSDYNDISLDEIRAIIADLSDDDTK